MVWFFSRLLSCNAEDVGIGGPTAGKDHPGQRFPTACASRNCEYIAWFPSPQKIPGHSCRISMPCAKGNDQEAESK